MACIIEHMVKAHSGLDESWLSRVQVPAAPASLAISQHPAADEKQLIEAALARTRGRVSGPSGAAGAGHAGLNSGIKDPSAED
jgi:hypothetical protein